MSLPITTSQDFIKKKTQEKEAFIKNVLYRRDLVCLAGRRRNGKTALILNLSVALTHGFKDFLGYPIIRPLKVSAVLLEDDTREIQDKLRQMTNEKKISLNGDLYIATREDFFSSNTPIGVENDKFKSSMNLFCKTSCPDVLILDNVAQLVSGDINNPKMIHKFIQFSWKLSQEFNCAVVVAAHPRKRGETSVDLVKDSEAFFEEVMGSSHFVNSFGSLWGIQRSKDDITYILVGAQRYVGSESTQSMILDDNRWFIPSEDRKSSMAIVISTNARRQAWDRLKGEFTYTDARRSCYEFIKSNHAFADWWAQLKQCQIIKPTVNDPRKFNKINK